MLIISPIIFLSHVITRLMEKWEILNKNVRISPRFIWNNFVASKISSRNFFILMRIPQFLMISWKHEKRSKRGKIFSENKLDIWANNKNMYVVDVLRHANSICVLWNSNVIGVRNVAMLPWSWAKSCTRGIKSESKFQTESEL